MPHDLRAVTCSQVQLLDYASLRTPALVGTIAIISCPPGLVLAGSNVTTCMANGHWDPVPKITMCKGEQMILYQSLTVVKDINIYLQLTATFHW